MRRFAVMLTLIVGITTLGAAQAGHLPDADDRPCGPSGTDPIWVEIGQQDAEHRDYNGICMKDGTAPDGVVRLFISTNPLVSASLRDMHGWLIVDGGAANPGPTQGYVVMEGDSSGFRVYCGPSGAYDDPPRDGNGNRTDGLGSGSCPSSFQP